MLEKWFNNYAKLLAQQLPKEYPTNQINPIPWIVHKENLTEVSDGVQEWLNNIHDITYISIRSGMEANFLVFLDRDMNKFHETYLTGK